jgi:hypothetical protein
LGDGVENADAHATTAAKMNAMVWKVFMLEIGCENRDYDDSDRSKGHKGRVFLSRSYAPAR